MSTLQFPTSAGVTPPPTDAASPGAGLPGTDGPIWSATGHETPVFADPTGRRARAATGIGLIFAAAIAAALVIVATAAVGFANLPAVLPNSGSQLEAASRSHQLSAHRTTTRVRLGADGRPDEPRITPGRRVIHVVHVEHTLRDRD